MKEVALLRGINLGGKNRLAMPALTRLFSDAGCTGVVTYIQSGNVIFEAPSGGSAGLDSHIKEGIHKSFGFDVPVILRTAKEIAQTIRGNPFPVSEGSEKTVHVYFLAEIPDSARVAAIGPEQFAPDRFHIRGRDVYIHVPTNFARTKLTNAFFDSKLKAVSTARNWNTVRTLHRMMSGA